MHGSFKQMYLHNDDKIKDAGVAYTLDIPVWVDMYREKSIEEESLICTVNHSLTYPEMRVIVNEIGGDHELAKAKKQSMRK